MKLDFYASILVRKYFLAGRPDDEGSLAALNDWFQCPPRRPKMCLSITLRNAYKINVVRSSGRLTRRIDGRLYHFGLRPYQNMISVVFGVRMAGKMEPETRC